MKQIADTDLVRSQSIENIIPRLDFKPNRKVSDKMGYMYDWMSQYHLQEELITRDFIVTPRGYQFIAEVFVPADRLFRALCCLDTKKAKEITLYYDYQWTKKWVEITEKNKGIVFELYPNQDLSVEDFCLRWLLKKNNIWNAWLSKHQEFKKKYIYKKGNRNWITKEGCRAYLETFNIGDQVRRMSFFISENLSGLRRTYSFIQKQDLSKKKNLFKLCEDNFFKRIKIQTYDLRIFYSNVENARQYLINTLKNNHPHDE